VDLPYGPGKAAIRIQSGEDLVLGSNCVLTALGTYYGRSIDLGTASDLYRRGFWARTMDDGDGNPTPMDSGNPGPMDRAYASSIDDRPSVGFSTESYYGGMPIDVAVYLRSSTGGVTVQSPITLPDGATMVMDGYNGTAIGSPATVESSFADTSRLETVVRTGPASVAAVTEETGPAWFTGYSFVVRSGPGGVYQETQEWWHEGQETSPPPLPIIFVPPVIPPIVLLRPEVLDSLVLVEAVLGPVVPPSPECVEVMEPDTEALRKCQVACDLFSTDVSLVPTAEDIITLDKRLKAGIQEILPRLGALSRKWPQPDEGDLPAIEAALQQDEVLGGWLHDGVELVTLAKKKLRPTSMTDLVGGIVRLYLGSAEGSLLDFVHAYFSLKLAAAAERTKPVARAA
jgi:hypothetical protein